MDTSFMLPIASFLNELVKIAHAGTYVSFFTGEKRTDATFFPSGTLKKGPLSIYKVGKDPGYAPTGPASSIRFLNYYMNRAGKNLDPEQKAKIEKARLMLHNYNEKLKKEKLKAR